MKTRNFTLLAMCLFFSMATTGWPQPTGPAPETRIGTYDSRAVAVAFAGSELFANWLNDLKTEYAQAKADGDTARAARLEAEGAERQKRIHRQAFSTASVDDILKEIRDELPAIRAEAGVAALVSKWDTDTLRAWTNARHVDVTTALIDALAPTDRQRKYAIEIQKKDPLPLETASDIRD